MSFFIKHKKLFISILIVTVGLLIYSIKNKNTVEILQLDEIGLVNYFIENNMDTSHISYGIEKKALAIFPENTSVKIKINKEKIYFQKIISKDKISILGQLQLSLKFLYLIFTEEMTIKKRPAFFKSLPFMLQETLINTGFWSPVCDDISLISSKFLKNNIDSILFADTLFIPYMSHYVTSVIYRDLGNTYITAIDFQNGFIGPIDSLTHKPLTIKDLNQRIKNKNFSGLKLYFLKKDILINKKTLIPNRYATNLFPDNDLKIYKTNFFHLYPANRKTYSTHYYIWFYLGLEDKEKMIREITKQLYLKIPKETK